MSLSQLFNRHPITMPSVILIPFLLAAFILATLVYRAFFHPLRNIPGPRLAALTELWRTYRYFRGTWNEDVVQLHDKYGKVVRIAPDEVSIVDAAATKQLYGHGKSAKKTHWYSTWSLPEQGLGIFPEQDGKVHALLRKRVSGAYAMSSILKYEKNINECIDLCFKALRKSAVAGQEVNMSEWTNALTFDVVGELAFGERLGHLESNCADINNLRHNITVSFFIGANCGNLWGQQKLVFNPVVTFLATLFGVAQSQDEFISWSQQKIDLRKSSGDKSERHDMLSHFLKMKSMKGDYAATNAEVIGESLVIIGAGADTTSIGMRACLYYLALNENVQDKLRSEVDEFYDHRQDTQEPITYQEAQGLPYLKAVISEALRLFPSIVYQLPRYAPAEGLTVGEYYIPAGYVVGTSAVTQNRDKAVYGEDANDFKPERWLESKEKAALYESNSMTFGGNGPRTCIGKNIALVEIYKFVAQIIREFDLELVDKENPWSVTCFWLAYQSNLRFRIRMRDTSGDS